MRERIEWPPPIDSVPYVETPPLTATAFQLHQSLIATNGRCLAGRAAQTRRCSYNVPHDGLHSAASAQATQALRARPALIERGLFRRRGPLVEDRDALSWHPSSYASRA